MKATTKATTRLLAGLIALLLVGWAEPTRGEEQPYTVSDETFTSGDGTRLYARVFRPIHVPVGEPTDAVVMVTPYHVYDDRDELGGAPPYYVYQALDEAIARGYSVIQVSLRGYGHSEGCGDFGGPGEQADAVAAVEWAATRSGSTGRVGMFGLSYDGWAGVMAMAGRARGLEAAVIASPIVSGYRGLYLNGVPYTWWSRWVLPWYVAHDLASDPVVSGVPTCAVDSQVDAVSADPSDPFWVERDLLDEVAGSRVPTLLSHGFADLNIKPDHSDALWPRLAGPKQGWFGQFPHRWPDHGGRVYAAAAMDWFDRHVRDLPAPASPATAVRVQDGLGRWRQEATWPPQDARHATLGLQEGRFRELAGNTPFGWAPDDGQLWSFTQPLPYAIHLAGTPRIRLDLETSSTGRVVVHLYDVTEDGTARLVTRGATSLDAGEQRIELELFPQDWVWQPGHRMGVLVSGSDDAWVEPAVSGQVTTVRHSSLDVPVLAFVREEFIEGQPPDPRPDEFGPDGLSIDERTIENNTVHVQLPPPMKHR